MTEEGYVKFICDFKEKDCINSEEIKEMNECRQKLYNSGLIGATEEGIGFGNISIRIQTNFALTNDFIISGTATGNISKLTKKDYCKIVDFDIDNNYVKCEGLVKASSETLTHAAVYTSSEVVDDDFKINAVVHVHNNKLWQKLLNDSLAGNIDVAITSKTATYGTPEIANEIIRLFKEDKKKVMKHKLIILAGHEDGIISFGKNVREATDVILNFLI